jgi:hypothetical protein
MSCSKIFSGDLPELTYEVLKHFKNDFSTLHSCILVNRLWCRLAIPLLWENPFSILTKNFNYIDIYLDNLNGDLKTKLNEYKIINNSLPSNTLFNYTKFLKYLNICKIIGPINRWFEVVNTNSKSEIGFLIQDLNLSSILDFKKLIIISLFKIFIENEVKLHTLEIEISYTYFNTYFDDILELILQNPNFIHDIRNLELYVIINTENTLIKNRISQIINSHQNLKRVLLAHNNNLPLYQSLLLSKNYNCSNTLNTIIFYYVNFKGIINLDKVFEQLNVLESVHIIDCFLSIDFTQQIINLTKPFKLKSLFMNNSSEIESLQLLLKKSGDYLENFGCGYGGLYLYRQLLELIMKYCKNISFLDLSNIESHFAFQIFNLVENIKQNLNYLSIRADSIILQNLGQTLPSKLEYLNLILYIIKVSDLEVFLKNSQDTFIKKLLIDNLIKEDSSDDIEILPYIKEYIMKKKRVQQLAIRNTVLFRNERDLSNLKDEVKEFKLHNIRVHNYDDLLTNINKFMMDNV